MMMKINIQDIIPFMKDGWVAMDENGWWNWFSHKPEIRIGRSRWIIVYNRTDFCPLGCFNITPADDWTKSLIKVGGK